MAPNWCFLHSCPFDTQVQSQHHRGLSEVLQQSWNALKEKRHTTEPVNHGKDYFGLWLYISAWISPVEVDPSRQIKASFHSWLEGYIGFQGCSLNLWIYLTALTTVSVDGSSYWSSTKNEKEEIMFYSFSTNLHVSWCRSKAMQSIDGARELVLIARSKLVCARILTFSQTMLNILIFYELLT